MIVLGIYLIGYIISFYIIKYSNEYEEGEKRTWDNVKRDAKLSLLSWFFIVILIIYLIHEKIINKIIEKIKEKSSKFPPKWL